jgi:hypothetical protein
VFVGIVLALGVGYLLPVDQTRESASVPAYRRR